MPSFDVVSRTDIQEVDNAVNNAMKEIDTRYDFKNTNVSIKWDAENLVLHFGANSENRIEAALDVFYQKAVKRGLDLKAFKRGDIKGSAGMNVKMEVKVQQGVEQDAAKKMIKDVKDSKIKVQASIQGDQLRITGKNRDDLQATIQLLKSKDYGLPLQYTNFRD
jgi:cyclic-di-GMP-binding protein